VLGDLETREHLGDITISTYMLAEVFGKDRTAVVEEQKEFFDGVTLHYKIYMPSV
jgi:hypothetical protein